MLVGAGLRVVGLGIRAFGHGAVARTLAVSGRGMTPEAAQFMRGLAAGEIRASEASLGIAGIRTQAAVSARAEGMAGGMNHAVSAQGTSGWDFVPVIGTARAIGNPKNACFGG